MMGEILTRHKMIKGVSESLDREGITVNVRFNGKVIAKAGAGAEPFMMGIVGKVEIVDMESAVKLADSLGVLA